MSNAEQNLRFRLENNPTDTDALLSLAEYLIVDKDYNQSRSLTLSALKCQFSTPKLMLRALKLLSFYGDSALIKQIISQVHPKMWDSAKSLAEVSHTLSIINANFDSKIFAEAAVERDPGHPPSLHMLATTELFFGNVDRVAELAERCLKFLPYDAGAHWLLTRVKAGNNEVRVERIKSSILNTTDAESLSRLYYALHYEYHAMKAYDLAWTSLVKGHQYRKTCFPYDKSFFQNLFERLSQVKFNVELEDAKTYEFTPIFIVGLHRSGTTLTERILTGHTEINAGEESYDFTIQLRRQINKAFKHENDISVLDNIDNLNFDEMAQGYTAAMKWRANGLPFLTDKLPSNYLNVPFLIKAFPSAKIVMLYRNPVDVAFSNMRTLFSTAGTYSYSQQDTVHYFKLFDQYRESLVENYPKKIFQLDYHQLTNNTEQVVKALCQFVGVEFQEQMVDIKSRKDSVATASSMMMRDGIRTDRSNVWQPYRDDLDYLIRNLAN